MDEIFDVTSGAEIICEEEHSTKAYWNNKLLPDEIINLKFPSEVEIAYSKTPKKKLVFKNCIFDTISIKNEHAEKIKEFKFINCQINSVRFFRSDVIIVIESSSIQSFALERCNIPRLRIESSKVENIFFESGSKTDETIINDSYITKLTSMDAEINKLELHSSHMEFLHIYNSINLLDIREGAVLERFIIENKEELKRFLKTLKKNNQNALKDGTVSRKTVELKHQHQIMIAAYNQYADENRFQEMDMCLVRLRKINCRLNSLSTNNMLKKAGYLIEFLIMGKMFGWGVQIMNSLITSAIIIIAFAGIYFYALISSMDSVGQCIQVSLMASVNRFFNVNEVNPISILEHFDTAEQIIGVIILTIFTGVIARKIIK